MNHSKLHGEIREIKMVDLKGQIEPIRETIDLEISKVIDETSFIKGDKVASFEKEFGKFHDAKYLISCGNELLLGTFFLIRQG